jgi:hypothetical protein
VTKIIQYAVFRGNVERVKSDARKHSLAAEGRIEIKCFQTTAKRDKESTDLTSVGKAFHMVGAATRKPRLALDSLLRGTSNKKRSEDERKIRGG